MLTSTNHLAKNMTEVSTTTTKSLRTSIPFGINFEEMCLSEAEMATTNTIDMNDDDTGTYRKDTEDNDT